MRILTALTALCLAAGLALTGCAYHEKDKGQTPTAGKPCCGGKAKF